MDMKTELRTLTEVITTKDGYYREETAERVVRILEETAETICHGGRYDNARLSDFNQSIQDMIMTHPSMYVWGGVGTGKTHLAVARAFEALRTTGISYWDTKAGCGNIRRWDPLTSDTLVFGSVPELMFEIRKSFNDRSAPSEGQILDKYRSAYFLVLDDLGANRVTPYCLEALYLIIDYRYRNNMPTLITSNLDPEALAKEYDDRMASRILSLGGVLGFRGSDKRRTK